MADPTYTEIKLADGRFQVGSDEGGIPFIAVEGTVLAMTDSVAANVTTGNLRAISAACIKQARRIEVEAK